MQKTVRILMVSLVALGLAATAFGKMHEQGEKEGLAALMQQNRQHLEAAVGIAYFEGVQRQLEAQDYQRISEATEAIAGVARQIEEKHSRGKDFDELAEDLREHAEKAGRAAGKADHPEVNVEMGEMAEYCAECHMKYRW